VQKAREAERKRDIKKAVEKKEEMKAAEKERDTERRASVKEGWKRNYQKNPETRIKRGEMKEENLILPHEKGNKAWYKSPCKYL